MNPIPLCTIDASQLIVVDLQIRLLSAMSESERSAVVKNTEILLQGAAILGVPVIRTEQYPKGLGPTVPALLERMPVKTNTIEKKGFSCFSEETFRNALKQSNRRQIILAGLEAHICVLQTAVELVTKGYQVFIAGDAVCSRQVSHKKNALSRMQNEGVIISNTESVLFEWLRDADHPHFKFISHLVQ